MRHPLCDPDSNGRGHGGRFRGGVRRFEVFELFHELREEDLHRLGRLGADAEPVLDPLRGEFHPVFFFRQVWVVAAQLLDDLAIAGLTVVDGHDAVVVAMGSTHLFHANANGH